MIELRSLRDLNANLWVFDCDGVIYKNVKEAEKEVVDKMIQFIALRYGCNFEKAIFTRKELLRKHDVSHSITALIYEGFNEQEILNKTYFAINLKELGIMPSLEIQDLFASLSGQKAVLTNNHEEFAKAVLNQLGVLGHFSAIYGISKLGRIQKPDLRAFQAIQDAVGIYEGIVFIDDKVKNIIAAANFGWTTILLGSSDEYDGFWLPKLR